MEEDTASTQTEHVEQEAQQVREVAAPPEAEAPTPEIYTGPTKMDRFKQKLHEWWVKLKEFWIECKRVLRVTKKPDTEEFKTIVKVSGIGMALIGAIGFIIFFLKELL